MTASPVCLRTGNIHHSPACALGNLGNVLLHPTGLCWQWEGAEHPPGREDEEKLSSPCTAPFPGQVKLIAEMRVHGLRIVTTRSVLGEKKGKFWVSNLCLAARRELGLSRGTCGPGPCCSSAGSTSDNVICLHLPSILQLHCFEELTDCSQRERFVLLCFGLLFFSIQTIQF